jgi:hypothetical protein
MGVKEIWSIIDTLLGKVAVPSYENARAARSRGGP